MSSTSDTVLNIKQPKTAVETKIDREFNSMEDQYVCQFLIGKNRVPIKKLKAASKISSLMDDCEKERLAYRENLKAMMVQVMDPKSGFFKIQKELINDQELLMESLHTVLIGFGGEQSKFLEYFKYKKKDNDAGTDYRITLRKVVSKDKETKLALETLLNASEFTKEDLGKERVLIFQFPNLTTEKFNTLTQEVLNACYSDDSSVVTRIGIASIKCFIFFIRNFNAKMLDLHGFDKKQAQENISAYVQGVYFKFQNKVSLMTGKGSHSKGKQPKGLSPMKRATLESLTTLKEEGRVELKSMYPQEAKVIAEFPSPVVVSEKDLPKAIQERKNRIIVRLDKQYSPEELEKHTFRLILTTVMSSTGTIESTFVPQEKVACDYVKLQFHYLNKKPAPEAPKGISVSNQGAKFRLSSQ